MVITARAAAARKTKPWPLVRKGTIRTAAAAATIKTTATTTLIIVTIAREINYVTNMYMHNGMYVSISSYMHIDVCILSDMQLF
jgi:hypothetical protein